jgi:hypothetical protein
MKQFESNQNVLAGKDAKRIIKNYNKVAKTLVAFEYLWYQAWVQSIDQAKAGLQATLIIRHPDDGKLYVNFDQEILQLIREAKCLDRMGIEVRGDALSACAHMTRVPTTDPGQRKDCTASGREVQELLQRAALGSGGVRPRSVARDSCHSYGAAAALQRHGV